METKPSWENIQRWESTRLRLLTWLPVVVQSSVLWPSLDPSSPRRPHHGTRSGQQGEDNGGTWLTVVCGLEQPLSPLGARGSEVLLTQPWL